MSLDYFSTCKIIVATMAIQQLGCLTASMKPNSGQPLHLSRDTTSLKFIRRLASSRFNAPHRTKRALYIYRCPRIYTGCADFPRIYFPHMFDDSKQASAFHILHIFHQIDFVLHLAVSSIISTFLSGNVTHNQYNKNTFLNVNCQRNKL